MDLQGANVRRFPHFTAEKSDHPPSHMHCLRMNDLLLAELVSKTNEYSAHHIRCKQNNNNIKHIQHACDNCHAPWKDIVVNWLSFKTKSSWAEALKVSLHGMFESPTFPAAICLSAGFSLFNQSNMKPGDLIPLEMYILRGFWEVTAFLSRAALKIEAVLSASSLLKGGFLWLWGMLSWKNVSLINAYMKSQCWQHCNDDHLEHLLM